MERLALCPDTRVGQQIINQALHPFRAIDGKGDVVVGFSAEVALVVLGQQLHIGGNHAQRLLQIMRCDVSKLLEIRVASLQRFLGFGNRIDIPLKLLVGLCKFRRTFFECRDASHRRSAFAQFLCGAQIRLDDEP